MVKKKKENQGDAEVRFDIEKNADEIFLESIKNIDENAIKKDKTNGSPKRSAQKKHKKSKATVFSIDLHGCTLSEAKQKVDIMLKELFTDFGFPLTVKVITGKGRHSGVEGSVLPEEIHRHINSQYQDWLVFVEDSPANVAIDGLPIRGHFLVKFDKKS